MARNWQTLKGGLLNNGMVQQKLGINEPKKKKDKHLEEALELIQVDYLQIL